MHPLNNDGLVRRGLQEVGGLGDGQGQTAAHGALWQEHKHYSASQALNLAHHSAGRPALIPLTSLFFCVFL